MNGLALCAGYGGLELGIEHVFPTYRTVCFVEGEAFAAQHLIQKMREGELDEAPLWSNVRTFDGTAWRGKVDIISGGFPCQPYSSAGKQMGKDDARDLWVDFVRIIGEVRPGFIFFENVPGIVKWRLSEIVLDLNQLGYNASWCVVAASDVGAPHQRKRWFLFGVSNSNNSSQSSSEGPIFDQRRHNAGGVCSNVSHTYGLGWDSVKPQAWWRKLDVKGRSLSISDTFSPGISGSGFNDGEAHKIRSGKRHVNPLDKWGGRFNQVWEVEPSMGRLVDGSSDWVDKIRLLGNGVVPQQAAYALQILGERLAWGMVAKREPRG